MPRKRYSTEQIVSKLRQAEVELSRGLRTPQVCKELGVSEQTGIVKLAKSSSSDPQDTGLQPVVNPPCWAPKAAVSLNLTVSIIPLPAEVAR